MKKNLSDQELDRLMQSVIGDGTVSEDELRSIADSPTVWWAVQREIAKGHEAKSPWPPANIIHRWLMILAPSAVAAAIVLSLFVWRSADQTVETPTTVQNEELAAPSPAGDPSPVQTAEIDNDTVASKTTFAKAPAARRSIRQRSSTSAQSAKSIIPAEIKTEFIALNYAATPKSGQIVRVKVPRSMMVTVGLVASVEKPTNLVDAEVLVGDDGLTRAIRFIH